MKNISNKPW